jgi:hypothetical protein
MDQAGRSEEGVPPEDAGTGAEPEPEPSVPARALGPDGLPLPTMAEVHLENLKKCFIRDMRPASEGHQTATRLFGYFVFIHRCGSEGAAGFDICMDFILGHHTNPVSAGAVMPGASPIIVQQVRDLMRDGEFWPWLTAQCAEAISRDHRDVPALPPIADAVKSCREKCLEVADWDWMDPRVNAWRRDFKPDGSNNEALVRKTVLGVWSYPGSGSPGDWAAAPVAYMEEVLQATLATDMTTEYKKIMALLIKRDKPNPKELKARDKQFGREWTMVDANSDGIVDITELSKVLVAAFGMQKGEATHVMDKLDLDGNGSVTKEEYFTYKHREANCGDRQKVEYDALKKKLDAEVAARTPEENAERIREFLKGQAASPTSSQSTEWMRTCLLEGFKKKTFPKGRIHEHMMWQQIAPPHGGGLLVGCRMKFNKIHNLMQKFDLWGECMALMDTTVGPLPSVDEFAQAILAKIPQMIYWPNTLQLYLKKLSAKKGKAKDLLAVLVNNYQDLEALGSGSSGSARSGGRWLPKDTLEVENLRKATIAKLQKSKEAVDLVQYTLNPDTERMKGEIQKAGGRGHLWKSDGVQWDDRLLKLDVDSLSWTAKKMAGMGGHDIPLEEIDSCWGLGPYEAMNAYGQPTEQVFAVECADTHQGGKNYSFLCKSEEERAEWLEKISAQRQVRLARIPPALMSPRHIGLYNYWEQYDGDTYPHVMPGRDGDLLPWVADAFAQGFSLSSEMLWVDAGPTGMVTVATATVKADVRQPTGELFNVNGEDAPLRSVLLFKTHASDTKFSYLTQVLPVENCMTSCTKATDMLCTFTVAKNLYPEHWAAGQEWEFSSRMKGPYTEIQEYRQMPDGSTRLVGTGRYQDHGTYKIKDNKRLHAALKQARTKNALQDAKTGGNIVDGANWAIVSFPGEEHALWGMIVYAPDEAVARTFDAKGVSLGCVWTDEPGDAWWRMWTRNCIDAYKAGQTLLVYSRRDWATRVESFNLSVPGEKNLSWPGQPINFKKGAPIDKYGVAQGRETEWLEQMITTGEEWDGEQLQFERARVLYKPVEEIDEIRAIDAEGNRWEGGWSNAGQDGPGTMVYFDGSKGEGVWVDGEEPDGEESFLKVTTNYGDWSVVTLKKGGKGFATTQYGNAKLDGGEVGSLEGVYEGKSDKKGNRDGKGILTYTNPNGGVSTWDGTWKFDRPFGMLRLTYPNGRWEDREYKHNGKGKKSNSKFIESSDGLDSAAGGDLGADDEDSEPMPAPE